MYAIRSYYEAGTEGPDEAGADADQLHADGVEREARAVEQAGGQGSPGARITSYNVCYTKLLRNCPAR